MTDMQLHQSVANLADRIRDLAQADVSEDIRQRCLALIRHPDVQGLMRRSSWNLAPRE